MDKGPTRRSRAASRGVINSSSGNTAPIQPPEPEQELRFEEPAKIEPPEPPRRETPPAQPITNPINQSGKTSMRAPRKRRIVLPVIIVIIVIAAAVTGLFIWHNNSNAPSAATGIDSSKYQAVFLTNGQVYFGKLQQFNSGYMELTDIWYLQTQSDSSNSSNPQSTSSNTKNVLVKLGNEVHGPEDQMIITKDQILFYENLKPDGTVSQTISKAQK